MKSQEDRIEDAAVALVSELGLGWRSHLDRGREIARAMLDGMGRRVRGL